MTYEDRPNTAYRFVDTQYAGGGVDVWGDYVPGPSRTKVELHTFRVVKHTPKGFFVDTFDATPRFVRLEGTKRYCVLDMNEAWHDFKERKRRQLGIYEARANNAHKALTIAEHPLPEDYKGETITYSEFARWEWKKHDAT